MLYITIIGIVCAVVADVGTHGLRISNETDMDDSGNRKTGGMRRLFWETSFKLDLSDDFADDETETMPVTTKKPWKRKRSVKTNLRDVAADAEIDMNKRIERLARESSQHAVVESPDDFPVTTEPDIRLKRRAYKKRRRFLLNPFKWKPAYNEQNTPNTQNALYGTTTETTPYMGVFERKMKEFRAHQRTRQPMKYPITFQDDLKFKTEELTTRSAAGYTAENANYKETTATTLIPPYVLESTDFVVQNDEELSAERYLKIRHALRNYMMKTKGSRCRRHKRCNRPYCPTRKCKKAPPLICLPYIKRGQDDMLKFMINVMQSMLDKSCNSRKPYALEKIRYKTCRPDDSWESIESEVLTGCETTTACPKIAPCGPFAILPFPLPFPPCTCPVTSPTTIPTCPTTCPPPTTPIIPIPPIPCPIVCPDIPKSRPCDSFTPPTMIIPTYFPPWPTTKPPCLVEPCPRSNVVPNCCVGTLPPWPTPPSFVKSSPYRRRIPVYHQRVNKMVDYPETVNRIENPEERKMNRYEFESVYDSPGQETIEETEIDVRSHHFDYDPDNSIDLSVFDMSTPSFDKSKLRKSPRRNYMRRYPKTEFSRRYDRRYLSSRQKRDENTGVLDRETTVTTAKTTTDSAGIHRSQYDSFVDKKKATTMRSAAIVHGPKRMSNHPQAKVFAKVFPESYSDIPGESPTSKVEKTTVTPTANSSSLMHLQLLAVCEGYLEMIKLLKLNNQTRGEDDLVQYCESEISKGFDSGRAKKSIETTTVETSSVKQEKRLESPASRKNIRNKVVVDILRSPVYREIRSQYLAKNAVSNQERRRRRKKRRRGFRRRPFRRTTTVDSVRLLRKRKGALVSWLFNKENADVEDEEEDGGGIPEVGNTTSTSSVTRRETSSTAEPETVYPVYAKMFGYDKGGELSDIEVMLRSLNERNETREIAKNMTVLAMLMNPEEEERDTGLMEEGGESELKHDSANFGGKARGEINRKKANESATVVDEEEVNEMIEEEESSSLTEVSSVEATTILGHTTTEAPKKNHTWNGTYAQAVSTAKELVKDYTIEFLNYAVYIIPIMFILLFLVCCLCFILKIMTHNRKKRKRAKRKVATPPSSETESETSESSVNRKRKKSSDVKRRSKKLWSAMKTRGNGDDDGVNRKRKKSKNDDDISLKDRTFMKRLRKKKKELEDVEEDENEERALISGKKRVSYHDSNDTDEPDTRLLERRRDDVAKERRELIALLEELKNLEDRDKKDSKSVFVQYMTTDYDDSETNIRRDKLVPVDVENFRRMSHDLSVELLRGTPQDVARKFEMLTRMFDRLTLGDDLSPRKRSVLMEEMENFKRRLGYRKYTKLKDNGVLCRP